jgi:hypothetical protein
MPNMDVEWEELERMAMAASADDAQIADEYPSVDTIERWKRLFGYSHMEAVRLIGDQRGDGEYLLPEPLSSFTPNTYRLTVTRERISDSHWALIQDEKEASGYDREAYEHSLQLPNVFKGQSATIPTDGAGGELMLLFRLGGLLDSPEKVKDIVGLEELPVVKEGVSETGVVKFCVVGKEVQQKLEEWLAQKAVLHD